MVFNSLTQRQYCYSFVTTLIFKIHRKAIPQNNKFIDRDFHLQSIDEPQLWYAQPKTNVHP